MPNKAEQFKQILARKKAAAQNTQATAADDQPPGHAASPEPEHVPVAATEEPIVSKLQRAMMKAKQDTQFASVSSQAAPAISVRVPPPGCSSSSSVEAALSPSGSAERRPSAISSRGKFPTSGGADYPIQPNTSGSSSGYGRSSSPSASPDPESPPRARSTGSGSGSGSGDLPLSISTLVVSAEEKQGTYGQRGNVVVNYIRLKTNESTLFYQYSVNFNPEIDSEKVRRGLLNSVKELDRVSFDGSQLFCTTKLPQNMLKLRVNKFDGAAVEINLKLVRQLDTNHPQTCQLLNNMFHRILRMLHFKIEKRAAYLTKNPIRVPAHSVDIWPGYVTSVSPLDGGLMLVCDVSHRVIRTETVVNVFLGIFRSSKPEDAQDLCVKAIVGQTVLTGYNDHTYKVDDVDFSMTPKSTFSTRDGEVSFVEYYNKAYNVQITNLDQPLLLHVAKSKDPSVEPRRIYLVPELCTITGLSDAMRTDFKVMKDIAQHTRPNPANRMLALKRFRDSVQGSADAMAEMEKWGVRLADEDTKIPARSILGGEVVRFGGRRTEPINQQVDFARGVTSNPIISQGVAFKWAIIVPQRERRSAQDIQKAICDDIGALGIQADVPRMCEIKSDSSRDYLDALERVVNNDVSAMPPTFDIQRALLEHLG